MNAAVPKDQAFAVTPFLSGGGWERESTINAGARPIVEDVTAREGPRAERGSAATHGSQNTLRAEAPITKTQQ